MLVSDVWAEAASEDSGWRHAILEYEDECQPSWNNLTLIWKSAVEIPSKSQSIFSYLRYNAIYFQVIV